MMNIINIYLNKLTLTIPLTPASSRASRQAASVTVSSSSHPPWKENKVTLHKEFHADEVFIG